MKQAKAKKIEELIKEFPHNIRAEVLVNELLESGFTYDDIEIENLGGFFRPFRKDVSDQRVIEYKQNEFLISLLLTRYGIYDILPEGMTHTQDISNKKNTAKTFIAVYKGRKKEENEARGFFKPFENELFHQMVALEKTEKELLFSKRARFFNFLVNFWNIDNSLRMIHQEALLYILPYIHVIAGNFVLICSCLEYFLKIKADYRIIHEEFEDKEKGVKLGKNNRLGNEFYPGNTTALLPKVLFTLGPIEPSEIKECINNGPVARFISIFFEYVIPMEFTYNLKWLTLKHETEKNKEQELSFGVLGYTVNL
jgi:hypothetical protein